MHLAAEKKWNVADAFYGLIREEQIESILWIFNRSPLFILCSSLGMSAHSYQHPVCIRFNKWPLVYEIDLLELNVFSQLVL